MRRILGSATVVIAIVLTSVALAAPNADAGSPPTPGVTATTVRVGIPYVDLASLASVGVKLNQGSFPDAYNALIAYVNAHGGIDGRKIVPYLVAVNPTGTAPAATACTQLTEDEKVFVALAPLSPDCYLEQHHTPTINSQFQGSLPPGRLRTSLSRLRPLPMTRSSFRSSTKMASSKAKRSGSTARPLTNPKLPS